MNPDDPRHGTYAGVHAHRKSGVPLCEPCRDARRNYQRRLSYDHIRNRKRRVSPKRAARHALALEAAGVPLSEVARRAGVARGTVFRAVGRTYPQPKTMEVRNIVAILSVPFPDAPANHGYVPRIGVIRRVRALNAIGWPRTEIARRLGMTQQNLTQLVNGCRGADVRPNAWVQGSTWHKVADLYDELCMTPGPSQRARIIASRKGWAPPLSWTTIDDPNETPVGILDPTCVTSAGKHRAETLAELNANRAGVSEACRVLHLSREALEKWCARHDLRALHTALVNREQGRNPWTERSA